MLTDEIKNEIEKIIQKDVANKIPELFMSKNMIKNRLIIGKNIKYLLFSKLDGTILENFKFEIPVVRKRTLGGRDNLSDKNNDNENSDGNE